MVRHVALMALVFLAACSRHDNAANQSAIAPVAPVPVAPTADTLAAKQVAQRYFDLLRAGDHAGALALWSDDATGIADGVKAFAAASRARGRYEGKAGDPTETRDTDGMRYVLVEASARVTSPKGKVSDEQGAVMLKRPVRGGAPWRIWGIDVRPRHCKGSQVARGFGCVQP